MPPPFHPLVRLAAVAFRTLLSIAGFGLAGIYAAAGLIELVVIGDAGTALTFGVSAAVTAGLIAILLPLLAPRDGGSDDDDDGGGPGGGDGGPPPPPWWPEFEREFWSHVDRPRGRPDRRSPREPTPA